MTAITPSETRALRGRLRGLESGAREIDDAPVEIRGELPEWLRGGLLLNGPALWDLPHASYRHWFDGLAMLHRVSLEGSGARYRSRFLRSADYTDSVAAGRPALMAFGTRNPMGFWQRLRNFGHMRMTDNGAVVMSRLGEQWIAQTETPLVIGFDPKTLETTGPVEFSDAEPMHLMSAHGITEADGTYWNAGLELGPKCTYKVFRVRPGSRSREVLARWSVRQAGYLHAMALTPGYALVWECAVRVQPLKFLFTGNAFIDNFSWRPQGGSRIHAVSRADGSVRSWSVPALMAFHAVQAYEEDGALVLELCTEAPEVFKELELQSLRAGAAVAAPHRALRYRLLPDRDTAEPEEIAAGVELPMVHGAYWTRRKARYAWCAGFDPARVAPMFDRTVKIDLDANALAATWQRGDAVQMEPLFVARPGSVDDQDGVLLVPTLADGDEGTVVAVVDPVSMQCMATLHLPQVVPFGFHAAWDAD